MLKLCYSNDLMKQLSDDEIADLLVEEEPLFRVVRTGQRPPVEGGITEQQTQYTETPDEAFQRGLSTGRQEAALIIAKRLLLKKCSPASVREITGLSTAQIKRIISLLQSS